MLFERKFEIRTRGLVFGPGLITTPLALPGTGLHWKVMIRSRESGEELWVRPFATLLEAQRVYLRLTGVTPWYEDRAFQLPHPWHEDELSYYIAAVYSWNSSVNNAAFSWATGGTACPPGVTSVDALILAGGGGGGRGAPSYGGGGGAAGGLRELVGVAVTPVTNYPVTVGAGGAGSTTTARGTDGGDSVWNSFTSLKGGGGGTSTAPSTPGGGSGTFGSGGGAGVNTSGTATPGGIGTSGQGFNGGAYPSFGGKSGGGGGAAGAGVDGSGSGNGGPGISSSITGTALFYGGGGGAGMGGVGGSSIGGNGGTTNTAGIAASPANRGSGGGGAGAGGASPAGAAGSAGVVILATVGTPPPAATNFPNLAMMGF